MIRKKRWGGSRRFLLLTNNNLKLVTWNKEDTHLNAELIKTFYTAFQERNADGMIACYHSDVIFSDPVFGTLRGLEATSMWRMLCERGKDLKIEYGNTHADEDTGSAH